MNQHVLTNKRVRPLPDPQRYCEHPEHNPTHKEFTPGMYLYECPECKKRTYYTVTNENPSN